jgi:excisionase family DNA binding protein
MAWTISSGRGGAAGGTALPQAALDDLARLLAVPRPPRLAVELTEAAAALGVSKKFFDQHVRPELRLVRRGRKVLVPLAELERWLEESSERTLEGRR